MDPIFPPELEEMIFTTTAKLNPTMTPTFLRLARRFRIWLEPLLYETISDRHPGQIKTVIASMSSNSKPPSFLQTTVRRLYLSQYNSISRLNTLKLLQLCTNVEDLVDLGHFVTPQLLPVVAGLPLRRVAINVDQLSNFGTIPRIDFAPLVFPFLTHISIIDSHIFTDRFPPAASLASLPALAYLSTNRNIGWHTLGQILEACPKLKVLMHVCDSDRTDDARKMAASTPFPDPRFVVVVVHTTFLERWEAGTTQDGGIDLWVEVEDFVVQRRKEGTGPLLICRHN
ncbi:hypothetical protein MSAN_01901400 [Mycena sanguinolenta]|uniref:F-box domain-containing protein n=1 Tax=Mycena sanguinolenta TaxID=230812 RepID=A0A8H6XPT3_9AGAR|nr:hypothetical protein MSAN_01901400 [Mycena sanguinolenta]